VAARSALVLVLATGVTSCGPPSGAQRPTPSRPAARTAAADPPTPTAAADRSLQRDRPDPWAPVAAQAASRAGPYGARVFADRVVTRREYEEATAMVLACGRTSGVTFTAEDRYGTLVFSSAEPDGVGVLNSCESGDVALVRAFWSARYKDPQREGDAVYLRCFRRAGLIPARTAPDVPLSDLIDRLTADTASTATRAAADRCLYDPAGSARTR
jgi:hypothetical protein